MEKIYGPFDVSAFAAGDRIEIVPHLDLWMQGARFGEVLRTTKTRIHVRLDATRRTIRLSSSDIFAIVT